MSASSMALINKQKKAIPLVGKEILTVLLGVKACLFFPATDFGCYLGPDHTEWHLFREQVEVCDSAYHGLDSSDRKSVALISNFYALFDYHWTMCYSYLLLKVALFYNHDAHRDDNCTCSSLKCEEVNDNEKMSVGVIRA